MRTDECQVVFALVSTLCKNWTPDKSGIGIPVAELTFFSHLKASRPAMELSQLSNQWVEG